MTVTEAATRYAALTALTAALSTAQTDASRELSDLAHELGLTKGEVSTPLGPITLAERKASTEIVVSDRAGLVAWCEQNLPSALLRPKPVAVVNEESEKQLLTSRFIREGDQVLDSTNGDILDFVKISVTPARAPGVSYRASETQREVKRAAADVTEARTQQLVAAVLEAHEALKAIES